MGFRFYRFGLHISAFVYSRYNWADVSTLMGNILLSILQFKGLTLTSFTERANVHIGLKARDLNPDPKEAVWVNEYPRPEQ